MKGGSILVVAAAVALALAAGRPSAAGDSHELEAVYDLVLAPLLEIGQSPQRVADRMGEVRSVEAHAVVGLEGETDGAVLHVLVGDGWTAEICESSSTFNLSAFRIDRSHRALRLPISIGDTRERAEKIVGPPAAERPGGRLEYRYPPLGSDHHLATLEVAGGRVAAIEWVFGLEDRDPCKRGRTEARAADAPPPSR